ncbi:MAG TPA: hypothetical protein VGS62_03815 [Streptosporangiaceae bacterium]|nr:hypothetical protein [Streptosporangiaceae bacterium]
MSDTTFEGPGTPPLPASTGAGPDRPAHDGFGPPPERRRKHSVLVVAILVNASVLTTLAVTGQFSGHRAPGSGVGDNAEATSTTTVAQEPLSSQTNVDATLGYAGSYNVVNQSPGTLTALPLVGQVVQEGMPLYAVNGAPVVLLFGSTPAYRSLSEGSVTGTDVAQLNADLLALGYATASEIPANSDAFGYGTKVALEKLQAALGLDQTGTLPLGQAVFLPGAARVVSLDQNTTVGGPAQPGASLIQASSTVRQVTIQLDAAQASEVAVGDPVTITLPTNQTVTGTVSYVGTVASQPSNSGGAGGSSPPTIEVDVTPGNPSATGNLDQAPVQVSITNASVPSALAVPVTALLALSSGGYAVEVVGANGVRSLVGVTTGIFDEATGMVQVSGSGLAAGQRVVVPAL